MYVNVLCQHNNYSKSTTFNLKVLNDESILTQL